MPNGIGAKGQQAKTPANPLPPKLSMQTRKRERSQAHRPTSLPSLAKHLFAALIVRRLAPHQDSVYASPSHTLTFGA